MIRAAIHTGMLRRVQSVTLDGSAETLVEALDTATRGRLLLLASVKRMAIGADINRKILASGSADFVSGAAGTGRRDFRVIRMDTFFHREAS